MILREFGGGPCPPYSPGGRVTSRLDLRDNRKVITDYRNLGIVHILTDLVVSSRYPPDALRKPPSRVVPRKASSCGLGHPWGRSPCGLPWVSGVVPPHICLSVLCRWTSRELLLGCMGALAKKMINSVHVD